MPTPHDALFKATFSDPAAAAGLCRTLLPAAALDHLKLDELEVVPGSFVEPELQSRHTDLLYSVPLLDGREAYLYALTEHQRRPPRYMPWRMADYLMAFYRRWLRDRPEAPGLPIVIPIVVYNGPGPWRAPRRLTQLLRADEATQAALAPHLLDVEFILDDLSQVSNADLLARAMPVAARATLLALRNADGDLLDVLRNARDLLRLVLEAPSGVDAIFRLMRYGVHVSDSFTVEGAVALLREIDEYDQVLPLPGSEGARLMSVGREEGREEGLKAGLEQGIRHGLKQGLEQGLVRGLARSRAVIEKQIQLKFGPLPDEVAARIARADFDQLERWGERVLFAATLAECLDL